MEPFMPRQQLSSTPTKPLNSRMASSTTASAKSSQNNYFSPSSNTVQHPRHCASPASATTCPVRPAPTPHLNFFTSGEFAIVFEKSFVCALLKKMGLDSVNALVARENSWAQRVAMEMVLILSFTWLCAALFGYSFVFSLSMETTNYLLRKTGNERLTRLSGVAFYAPEVVFNWFYNPNRVTTTAAELVVRGTKSAISCCGASFGWYVGGYLSSKKTNCKKSRPNVPVHLIKENKYNVP